ncbi:hypothetical protein [Ectothiorhodospira shaposhnikovii]|uniref:hypothetical protein n=1 Tax=Ectothiorhodospira shaposhnikovii TaxID=1054 RepID=UPI0019073179|nr:hypothetical protein [Ectothiorhodospira shaposhnikovii]
MSDPLRYLVTALFILIPVSLHAQPDQRCVTEGCEYMPDVPCTFLPQPRGCDPAILADEETISMRQWMSDRGDEVVSILNLTRGGLRDTTEWVARGIDKRFGDEPFETGRGVSGNLRLNTLWRQDRPLNTSLRIGAQMDLPNLKDRTYLFFGLDNEDELVTDQPEAFTRQEQLLEETRRENQTRFAGLGYALKENVDLRAGVRGGYKVYLQARYRKSWWLSDRDEIEFRETIFWTLDDRFGSTTALNYEHAYSPRMSFRWGNVGTFSETTNGLSWSSSLGVFRSYGPYRLLSLEALVSGETDSHIEVAEYGIRTIWRQSLYEDWLMGRFILGYFWPKEEKEEFRREALAAGLGMEIRF